jgi:hypothetical protein
MMFYCLYGPLLLEKTARSLGESGESADLALRYGKIRAELALFFLQPPAFQ